MSECNNLSRRNLFRFSLAAGLAGLALSGSSAANEKMASTKKCPSTNDKKNMHIKKLRHVGIFTDNLDHTIKKYSGFGFSCGEIIEVKKIGARIAFVTAGDSMIEFVQITNPLTERDHLSQVVLGQRGTINHICYEVDDLEACIAEFENNGAKLVEGCPQPGAHGRIAFFYPETTEDVLIELCEI